MAGDIIISIAYGIDIQAEHDPHITAAQEALHVIEHGSCPRASILDTFPFRTLLDQLSWEYIIFTRAIQCFTCLHGFQEQG